jgi:hypothetical protein
MIGLASSIYATTSTPSCETDRVLGTRGHAQPARVAVITGITTPVDLQSDMSRSTSLRVPPAAGAARVAGMTAST